MGLATFFFLNALTIRLPECTLRALPEVIARTRKRIISLSLKPACPCKLHTKAAEMHEPFAYYLLSRQNDQVW